MTKDEALKMAIEALSQDEGWFEPEKAIKACKEALEQPTVAKLNDEYLRDYYVEGLNQPAQEPVGKWESKCKCDFRTKLVGDGCRYCNTEEYIDKLHADYNDLLEENEQLLTHPHQWQGLTDDEIAKSIVTRGMPNCDWNEVTIDYLKEDIVAIARAIEQALKDKNICT